MADTGPLWVRLVVATIPLLAALIAGLFALTNTVNRRVERLKNLHEVRKEFPDWLDPDLALERVILRELRAIDYATTPILKWVKRIRATFWVSFGFLYVSVVLDWLKIAPQRWAELVAQWNPGFPRNLVGLVPFLILYYLDTLARKHHEKQFEERYARGNDAIDERAQRSKEPFGDSEPQDTAEPPEPTDSHD